MAPSTPSVSSTSPSSGARKKRWASPGADSNSAHHEHEAKPAETVTSDLQNVTSDQVQEPWNDCEESQHRGLARLPNLPFEILYSISSELRRSKSIFDFALVNRYINSIAQQALIREAIIPKNGIRPFLEILVARQELIRSVKAVDLGNYVCGHPNRCLCVGKANFDAASMKFLNKAVAANTGKAISLTDIRRHMRRPGPVWRKNHAFFLYILLSLCPNITSVAFELPELTSFDSSRPPVSQNLAPSDLPILNEEIPPVTPFHGPVLGLMQKKLEVLIITEDSKWKGPVKREILYTPQDVLWRSMGKFTITLPGFLKLKRLDLPMEVLGRPQSIVFMDPTITNEEAFQPTVKDDSKNGNAGVINSVPRFSKAVPYTLQHLHLRSCNQWTFSLLQKINEIPREKLHLKQIELFFKTCPQSSISLCYAADEGQLNYPCILSELCQKGIKLSFFTGKDEMPFNMRKELAALIVLSPLEVWRFALSKIPYSDLNEGASLRRRQSITASHLFMKHAHNYLSLMNTSTFNGNLWARAAFFHGFKNTKWDPGVLPHTSKVQALESKLWSTRALGKRDPKPRLPVLLDLSNSSFEFRVEQIITPPPTEVFFLGKSFSVSTEHHPSQKEKSRNSSKKVHSDKGDTITPGYRQGHWIDRVEASKSMGEKRGKSLEQNMTQLRLADHLELRNRALKVNFTKDSKFQSEVWTTIVWKSHLRAPVVSGDTI